MFPCKALDRPRPVLVQGFWLRCWYVCVCEGEWGETGRMGSKTGFILACTRSALDPPVLDRTHAYMTFARAGCSGSLVVVDQSPPLVLGFGGVPFWSPLASAWAALAPLPHSSLLPYPLFNTPVRLFL